MRKMAEENKKTEDTVKEETVKEETEKEEVKKEKNGECAEKKKKDASKKECAKLKEEIEKQKDAYMRLAAEYDNYRKRTQKEKEEIYTDAISDALKQILPVVDNLERALKYGEGDKVVEGVKMTYDKFEKVLSDMGVEEIECKTFDPNYHNAVMHIEDEAYGESEIVECFEKGYKKGDKVIRYAMVKVAN